MLKPYRHISPIVYYLLIGLFVYTVIEVKTAIVYYSEGSSGLLGIFYLVLWLSGTFLLFHISINSEKSLDRPPLYLFLLFTTMGLIGWIGFVGNIDAIRDAFGVLFIDTYVVHSGIREIAPIPRYVTSTVPFFTTFYEVSNPLSAFAIKAALFILLIQSILLLFSICLAAVVNYASLYEKKDDVIDYFYNWLVSKRVLNKLQFLIILFWLVMAGIALAFILG